MLFLTFVRACITGGKYTIYACAITSQRPLYVYLVSANKLVWFRINVHKRSANWRIRLCKLASDAYFLNQLKISFTVFVGDMLE